MNTTAAILLVTAVAFVWWYARAGTRSGFEPDRLPSLVADASIRQSMHDWAVEHPYKRMTYPWTTC